MELLRPAAPPDSPAIRALIAAVYAEYGCVLDEEEEPHLRDPGAYFRESGGDFWVLETDGQVRATVAVALHDDAAELKSLYAHPELRGKGVGARLAEHAMQHARERGRRRMFLWSDTRFEAAHRLYRRLGFVEVGSRELHDSNHSVELGFERPI
jgi:N-acetylglutamate synthase-like GNAT family acetyltransferase